MSGSKNLYYTRLDSTDRELFAFDCLLIPFVHPSPNTVIIIFPFLYHIVIMFIDIISILIAIIVIVIVVVILLSLFWSFAFMAWVIWPCVFHGSISDCFSLQYSEHPSPLLRYMRYAWLYIKDSCLCLNMSLLLHTDIHLFISITLYPIKYKRTVIACFVFWGSFY